MALVNNFDGRFFFCSTKIVIYWSLARHHHVMQNVSQSFKTWTSMQNMKIVQVFFVATRDHISSRTQHKHVLLPLKYILWEEFWSLLSMFSVSQGNFFPCSVLSSKTTYSCSVISYYSSSKIHFIGKFCSLYASWLVW